LLKVFETRTDRLATISNRDDSTNLFHSNQNMAAMV
jgi:hypothetical protein